MSEQRTFMLCASTVVAIGIIILGSCEIYQSSLVADMVKDGVDPVRAACAFSTEKRNNPACIAEVTP